MCSVRREVSWLQASTQNELTVTLTSNQEGFVYRDWKIRIGSVLERVGVEALMADGVQVERVVLYSCWIKCILTVLPIHTVHNCQQGTEMVRIQRKTKLKAVQRQDPIVCPVMMLKSGCNENQIVRATRTWVPMSN